MGDDFSTVERMNWWAYVQQHSGKATHAKIAEAVGVTPPSVSRWGKGSNPDPAQAAAFARAYDRPVLEAFIAAGFLTPSEAGEKPSAPPSLASLGDDDLLDEVRRRMQGGSNDASAAEAEKRREQAPVLPNLNADDYTPAARRGRKRGKDLRDELDKFDGESQERPGE